MQGSVQTDFTIFEKKLDEYTSAYVNDGFEQKIYIRTVSNDSQTYIYLKNGCLSRLELFDFLQ